MKLDLSLEQEPIVGNWFGKLYVDGKLEWEGCTQHPWMQGKHDELKNLFLGLSGLTEWSVYITGFEPAPKPLTLRDLMCPTHSLPMKDSRQAT